jgi:hypothetical protein
MCREMLRRIGSRRALPVCLLVLCAALVSFGNSQQTCGTCARSLAQKYAVQASGQEGTITFRASSSLVLIDVLAQDLRTGLPLNQLKREDFQIFNDGHPVPIATLFLSWNLPRSGNKFLLST